MVTARTQEPHDRVRATYDILWYAFTVLLLAGFVPLAVLNDFSFVTGVDSLRLFVIVLVASVGVAHSLVSRPALMSAGFWITSYLLFGLAPLAQYSAGVFPLGASYGTSHFAHASALLLVGMAAWLFGYAFDKRRHAHLLARRTFSTERARTFGRIAIVSAIAFIVVIGPTILFSSRQELGRAMAQQFQNDAFSTVLYSVGTIPVAMAIVSTYLLWRREIPGTRIALVVVICLTLITSNVFTSNRTWLGTLVLALGLTLSKRGISLVRTRVVISLWLFGFLYLLPLLGAFRYEDSAFSFALQNPRDSLTTGDFDAYQQLAAGIGYVESQGAGWGEQIVGSILFFIPRSVWSGKPESTGTVLGDYYQLENVNLSAPLWLEGYVDFMLPGVVLYLFLWGWICGALDRALTKTATSAAVPVAYVLVPFLAFWQVIILRGSLSAVLPAVVTMVVCALAMSRRKDAITDQVDRANWDGAASENR